MLSELRQDLVSGDWVVIATGRAKRPHDFLHEKRKRELSPQNECPFETLHNDARFVHSHNGEEANGENWSVQAIPNKYPAFDAGACAVFSDMGPYRRTDGTGAHEVVVSRDHTRSIAEMSAHETELILAAYQERYRALANDACVQYVSIFHNHGPLAGATITHPHSQIIAIPVVPPDVGRSLDGSLRYFTEHGACVHCAMLTYEQQSGERVIYQNNSFTVLAPYASRSAFEVRIFPKVHTAQFEKIEPADRLLLADALQSAFARLFRGLHDPDYNFFIHTAPVTRLELHQHYHWHMEILPKTAIWAGFEISTGIEISTIAPESAAEFLRSIKEK